MEFRAFGGGRVADPAQPNTLQPLRRENRAVICDGIL